MGLHDRKRVLAISVLALAIVAATVQAADAPRFPGVLPKPKDYREHGSPRLLVRAGGTIRVQIFGKHAPLVTGRNELIAALTKLGATAQATDEGARIRIGIATEWPSGTAHLPSPPADKPEGYALAVTTTEAGETTVAIRGTDAMGAYYGIQTLIQLFDRVPEGVTVRQAEVRDWPTFTYRLFKGQCWYYRDNLMFVRWAPQFKWNVFASCYTDSPDWRDPPETYRAMIAEACKTVADRANVQFIQLGNPYMLKEKAIRATSDADVETLEAFFELSLSKGSKVLMLCLDDFAFLPKEDQAKFADLAGANASIVKRFTERVWAKHPGTRILVCPPPYWLTANKVHRYEWAHEYLRSLCANIPREVSIVWTGREVTTPCQETADVKAYQELIGADRHLFLWDNTLKLPPGWGNVFHMNAFLASCDHVSSSAWPKMAEFTRGEAGINTYGPGEIYKVPLMTTADYLWNPEQYDPQDSMRRALYWFDDNRLVGPMVHHWINELHSSIWARRLAFLKAPTGNGFNELQDLTRQYQAESDRISAGTSNRVLVDTLRPYLRRHTEALPILSDILEAWNLRQTDPSEARKRLALCKEAFAKLAKTLEKGDLAGDHYGLVLQELEPLTAKAIDSLIAGVATQPATPAKTQ
jgi:hypothetical protein